MKQNRCENRIPFLQYEKVQQEHGIVNECHHRKLQAAHKRYHCKL